MRIEGVGEVAGVDLKPPVEENTVLTDRMVADAVRELERQFRRAGYRGTRVSAESTTRADGGTVDLVFNVLLGQRARLQEIRVAGATDTSPALIERTMALDEGEALSFDRLNRARDRLYDTGLFRTVNLETAPIPNADGTPNPGLLRANVTVEELPKYRLRYGFQLYDPSSPLFDPKWGSGRSRRRRGPHPAGAVRPGSHRRYRHAAEPLGADRSATYISSRTFFGLPAQTNFYRQHRGREDGQRRRRPRLPHELDHVRPARPLPPAAPGGLRLQLREAEVRLSRAVADAARADSG